MSYKKFIGYLIKFAAGTGELRKVIWFLSLIILLALHTEQPRDSTLYLMILIAAGGPIWLFFDKDYQAETKRKYKELEKETGKAIPINNTWIVLIALAALVFIALFPLLK